MNLETVFEFIKVSRGYDYPITYKLVKGIPLSEDELTINGNLDLRLTDITTLPDNLKVGGSLELRYTKITTLPDNLHVGGYLDLENTKITSLPNNLKVGDDLYIRNTPLSEKYSEEEIRKIIEDKGGSVGDIYI